MRLVNSIGNSLRNPTFGFVSLVGLGLKFVRWYSPVFLASVGNPEPEYSLTRHNIGHRFINQLVDIYWKDHIENQGSYYTSSKYPIIIFKDSHCYMNLQGKPISNQFKGFKNHQLYIVHDDVQNQVGKYKIRAKGTSAQGHNGLRSVIQYLGNNHVKLAIGIGRPSSSSTPLHKWVLGKFDKQDLQIIDYEVIPKLVQELEKILQEEMK